MSYITDNRWSPGSSGAPENLISEARAAYAARWLDHHDRVDILPDRQGFAYDDTSDRDELMASMSAAPLQDVAHLVVDEVTKDEHDGIVVWRRRCGGYIYIDVVAVP